MVFKSIYLIHLQCGSITRRLFPFKFLTQTPYISPVETRHEVLSGMLRMIHITQKCAFASTTLRIVTKYGTAPL